MVPVLPVRPLVPVRATLRWIRADLAARRGQVLMVTAVIAGVVASLLLSATVLAGATNPWQGLFAQTRGAQAWMRLAPGTGTAGLARIGGVTAVAGPYPTAVATLAQGPVQSPVGLRAMTPAIPAVGRPLVREGTWLTRRIPDGVVVEASFAQAVHVSVGDRLLLNGIDGNSARVRVIGIADSSDQGFYPDQEPGQVWALRGVLDQVEPVPGHTEELVGMRLADPGQTGLIVQQAVTQLGSASVLGVTTWTEVEQSMARGDPLLGLLLALFGLIALGAAVLAIANATGGRVLVQLQELATMKTLGFTPGQVMGVVVAQQAAIGMAGTAIGLVAARAATIPLLHGLPAGVLPGVAPLPAVWTVLVGCGTELAVLIAAAVPGWRAGRVRPVATTARPQPSGHLSGLTRAALRPRLPLAVVLGVRAAFIRRLPTALTVSALAVTMTMITVGLGFVSTLDDVQQHPASIGLAAALTVNPGQLSAATAQAVVYGDRQAAAVYPSVEVSALLPGEQTTITTLGMGTSKRPFPFHVAAGRIYRAPGEAVASQGLLDVLHLRLGAFVRMPIGGVPVIFHIVGRIIEACCDGQVLAYGIDTLAQAGAAMPPMSYSVVLRPGISASAARARLLRGPGAGLDVSQVSDPADQLGVVRAMLTGLIAILGLIGLTSLLTASAVGRRDHLRDLGVLRAMGLTPAQLAAALVTSTAVLALVGTAAGTIAGLALATRLINAGAQAYGIGAGIGRPPSAAAIGVAVIAAVVVATTAAILPARRAAAAPVRVILSD
jgi:putative ABC transport system permease protein